jgi:hypothetical protein
MVVLLKKAATRTVSGHRAARKARQGGVFFKKKPLKFFAFV